MAPLVTVDELYDHVGTDATDGVVLGDYLAAAIGWVEDYTVLLLTRQNVVDDLDRLGNSVLRRWPVVSITSVTYYGSDGASIEVPAASYRHSTGRPARLLFVGCPPRISVRPGAAIVNYVAGFDGDVPDVVNQAIRLLVGEFFQNREAGAVSTDARRSLSWLLNRYRRRTL